MIPVVLSTGSMYTYGTARAMALAAQAGYDGVELIVDDRWDTRQASYLQGVAAQHDIPVVSVHSPFASLRLPGWPRSEVERVKRALELAEALGARTLNLHLPLRVGELMVTFRGRRWLLPTPFPEPSQVQYAGWLVDGGLAALQASTPVSITVENLPVRRALGRRFNAYAMNTWPALQRFPRVCFDTTHCGTTGADILAVYEQLADRVAHVHLSDYDGRAQHRALGRGHLPLAALLHTLARREYGGVVVVELDPGGLPVHDETRLAAELKRNLAYCRMHLGQATTEGQRAAAGDGAARAVTG